MKVVLFAAGLGTRIRDYPEAIPKPMIPIGSQPILLHLMNTYSQYGHQDFVVCVGYKANVIKEFFLNYRPEVESDLLITGPGTRAEILGNARPDWRISLIDTGHSRNIGERLLSVRSHIESEDMFFANYSDGLADVDLGEMVSRFKESNKAACFLAVRPPLTYHFADIEKGGRVKSMLPIERSEIWINGGFFIFRQNIFDFIEEGEDLVEGPFERLIEADQLLAFKHEGFWRGMDTLRDREVLEEMVNRGRMPWLDRAGEQEDSRSLH